MVDFSEEQEAEIQKRIEDARKEEQYKTAGLTGYKICLQHLAGLVDRFDEKGNLVQRGALDAYVLSVMEAEFAGFLRQHFPKPEKKEDRV